MVEAKAAAAAATSYVNWEEVVVSNDRGRRVVHYYLKPAGGGGAVLAVVGREKSVRHMSYAVPGQFLRSLVRARPGFLLSASSPSSSSSFLPSAGISFKWRSRREVIDWLSSLVSDSVTYGSSPMVDRFADVDDAEPEDLVNSKGLSSGNFGDPLNEFSWIGSSWECRKKRQHYPSFCKNGVTISVHNFVYILSEENKRLVAHVQDLYEDLRSNKMVVVQWFHKVDELGIHEDPDDNDREIFFSSCLQDLRVECIDGLAAVLSPQHFQQFQSEVNYSKWNPYLCHRQFDNDDVRPFDITQVQGYWNQELLKSMLTSPLKLRLKVTKVTRGISGSSGQRSDGACLSGSKRKHQLHTEGVNLSHVSARDGSKCNKLGKSTLGTFSNSGFLRKALFQKQLLSQLTPGCHVEVLSQDSGIRGCWFRCVILKRHQDKIKVCYQDLQDPDETGNLEEWVLLSRIASPDKLGLRLGGRPTVRPFPSEGGKLCNFEVGTIVDAWWHDGWWEGIVVRKESEVKLHVYFPGEKQTSVFCQGDLRQSQDWINNEWNSVEDRKDVANLVLLELKSNYKHADESQMQIKSLDLSKKLTIEPDKNTSLMMDKDQDANILSRDSSSDKEGVVLDLAKHCQIDGLKWSSLKRRKHRKSSTPVQSKRRRYTCSSPADETESNSCGGFVLPKSLAVIDHDNCKIAGDPLFSVPQSLSSLVMSQ